MITRESNQETWEKIYRQWLREGKPSYIAIGSAQYQVLQLHGTGEVGFKSVDGNSMMGSSSVAGMVK